MKVSGRVLAEGGDSGFLEKRLFYGGSESLWAAVLFATLEGYSITPEKYWPKRSQITSLELFP